MHIWGVSKCSGFPSTAQMIHSYQI